MQTINCIYKLLHNDKVVLYNTLNCMQYQH